MKNTLKIMMIVMALLGVMTSSANGKITVSSNENTKSTIIKLDDVRKGHQLLIKSNHGTVLYNESISQTGVYKKEFDLTTLPDGIYFFELDKDVVIQIIPFSVLSNTVKFDKDKEVKVFKPVVQYRNNKLTVSKLALDLKPMTVEIFYDNPHTTISEKIHSEKIENTKIIERVYILDQKKPGTYRIVTKTDGRSYTQMITI
ncbi:MAG: hypothetical protein ACSHXF_02305 [Aquaticitalea sp.]